MPKIVIESKTHIASAVDPRDQKTPDNWVKRHPDLIRLTGKHPFNCEPPLDTLHAQGFITPPSLHYVRNHGVCPKLTWEEHKLVINGLVAAPLEISMDELAEMPSVTLPVLLVCAGNRRKEQNMIKQTIGFHWGAAGLANGMWTGVRLSHLLEKAGYDTHKARHVEFIGVEDLPNKQDGTETKYGTSIDMNSAMDPAGDVIIAYKYNGEKLHPDHGFPVRVIIPGWIGGRMVKWLKEINVLPEPSTSHYHFFDNRIMPPHVTQEIAKNEGWWFKPEYLFNQLNINSAIACPANGETLPLAPGYERYAIKGYAYSGGGRKVTRVEISFDSGLTWNLAQLDHPELEHSHAPKQNAKWWCWCFFQYEVETISLLQCKELRCRAWDEASNCQPANLTWNVMGMGNNPHFRVEIHPETLPSGGFGLRFVHPTTAGPTSAPDGTTTSGGWMGIPNAPRESLGVATEVPKLLTQGTMGGGIPTYSPPSLAPRSNNLHQMFPKTQQVELTITAQPYSRSMSELQRNSGATLSSKPSTTLARPASDVFTGSDTSNEEDDKTGVSSIEDDDDGLPLFTMEEVAKHNTPESCWLVIQGKIYDTTSYNDMHPGGAASILMCAGEDGTEDFEAIAHSENTLTKLLKKYYIGKVGTSASPTQSAMSTSSEYGTLLGLHPKRWVDFALEYREMISPDTVLLRFALPSKMHRLGLPTGWHLFIRFNEAESGEKPRWVMRAYTPTSLDTDLGIMELVIKIYRPNVHPSFPKGGKMSQHLGNLSIGDSIHCKGPVGHFEYKNNGNFVKDGKPGKATKLGFICGGTGITPAYQIIKHALQSDEDTGFKIALVFANRTVDDILLRKELDELAMRNPTRFHLHYTLSSAPDGWNYSVGLINNKMIAEHIGNDCTLVGLCGPPGMIDHACKPALAALDYDEQRWFLF